MPAKLPFVQLSIGIAGSGRLAQSLARALGPRLRAVWARRPEAAREVAELAGAASVELGQLLDCDLVFCAISDEAIGEVVERMAPTAHGSGTRFVAHAAGALGIDVLAPLADALPGLQRGVWHPLASLADPTARPLAGRPVVAHGDAGWREVASALASACEAELRWVDELDPALYHAAAALLANGCTGLIARGAELLAEATGSRLGIAEARSLVESALTPLETLSPEEALTGPIRRGDAEVVAAHRQRLAQLAEPLGDDALALYDEIALAVLAVAERAGLAPEDALIVKDALFTRLDGSGAPDGGGALDGGGG